MRIIGRRAIWIPWSTLAASCTRLTKKFIVARRLSVGRMGGVLGLLRARPVVTHVEAPSCDELFDAPLTLRVHFGEHADERRRVAWRVAYEVDVAHSEKRVELVRDLPRALSAVHKVVVPGEAWRALYAEHAAYELCNVGALTYTLHEASDGEMQARVDDDALVSLTAVVEVFNASGEKTRAGALRRRVYALPAPGTAS